MLKKFANATISIDQNKLIAPEKALHSEAITERFKTITAEIKKVSPRSQDFLYFIARGIHAMEHAAVDPVHRKYDPKIGHMAYNDGNGNCHICKAALRKSARQEPIDGLWCESSTVDPFLNQNGDAFSERELLAEVQDPQNPTKNIKAYQTFIGKGLFTDHKSSEVENIRGIILDAAYDDVTKGVDLLIALDKVAYPELARQITAGYSTDVSMGCQVSYSLCSDCGNKAVTEADYCGHVKTGKGHRRAGAKPIYEINNGLNFIEISMVSNGADPRAKIKTVLASLNKLRESQNHEVKASTSENQLILDSINRIEREVHELEHQLDPSDQVKQASNTENEMRERIAKIENQIKTIAQQIKTGGDKMAQDQKQNKKAYMQGTVDPDVGNTFDMSDKDYHQYWMEDKHMVGPYLEGNGTEGLAPGYGLGSDEEVKKMYLRANAEERKKIRAALAKKIAYMQGTVEPDVNNVFDMSDKDYHQYWEEDKQMVGQGMETGKEGLHPGYGMGSDEQVKKELLRAKLRARLVKSANPKECRWTVFAGNEPVLAVTAEQAYGDELNQSNKEVDANKDVTNFDWFASKAYGLNLLQAIKHYGLTKVAKQFEDAALVRTAQAAPAPEAAPSPAEAAPMPDAGAAGGEAPAEGTPEHEAEEMEATEAIKAAADQISEATTQIVSMVGEIEQEHPGAGAKGEELAGGLAEVGGELDELSGEMAGAPAGAPQTAALKGLVRMALAEADVLLRKSEAYFNKYQKKTALTKTQLTERKAQRRKFADQIYDLTEGDIVAEAHPEGGNTTTFPKQEEGKVETVTEAQKADLEVANSMPRGELTARKQVRQKVLEAAKKILAQTAQSSDPNAQKLNQATEALKQKEKEKAAAAQQVANVASEAAKKASTKTAEVDKETKQYYSELASETATGGKPDPEVKKFYNELTQDYHNKKATAQAHNERLRTKRAYNLALKRAELGQIEKTQDAVENDVDRLLLLSDEQFTHFADVIENTKKVSNVEVKSKQVRTAGALNVGMGTGPAAPTSDREIITAELDRMPWSR